MSDTPRFLASGTVRAVTGELKMWCVALGLALGGAPLAGAADVAVAKEHQLKAAFIYSFTKFVEWPALGFLDADSPIVIGAVGSGPLLAEMERVVKGRKVNGRGLVVRRIETPADVKSVHLLFLSASEIARLPEFLTAAHGESILMVGETELFFRQGGTISLLIEDEKIRFDINLRAAERDGVKISAQLLKLARTVRKND